MKKGLSYFPLDTDFMRNQKMQRLLLEYGCEGLSVFIVLLCEIYATNGYYMPISHVLFLNTGFILKLKEEKVKKIISFCVQLDLFNQSLYDNAQILTSYGIQERYKEISKRTKNKINPAYLIEPFSVTETEDNVTKISVYATETSRVLNENENINENKTGTNHEKFKSSTNNNDESRRAEILRMAADATADRGNA